MLLFELGMVRTTGTVFPLPSGSPIASPPDLLLTLKRPLASKRDLSYFEVLRSSSDLSLLSVC